MRCTFVKHASGSWLPIVIGLLFFIFTLPGAVEQVRAAPLLDQDKPATGSKAGPGVVKWQNPIFIPIIRNDLLPFSQRPDLSLVLTDGGVTFVLPGRQITYNLAYANSAAHATGGVVLVENLPAHTVFDAVHSSAGWNQVGATSQYRMELGGLSASANGSVNFVVTVTAAPPAEMTSVTNQASIADDGKWGADPNPSNNTTARETSLNLAPDLAVTVSGEPAAIKGTATRFILQYTNLGYNPAEGVVITETLPAHTSFNPADNSAGWLAAGGDQYTYTLGSLAKGDAGTLTFTVRLDADLPAEITSISNTISITSNQAAGSDPDLANNSATHATPLSTGPTSFCANITSDTHWVMSASPYVLTCSINIDSGATLTLEPGTILKIQGTGTITINGELNVQGTEESLVTITSFNDDTVGGDTNGDGSGSSPAAGNWNSLIVTSTGTVNLSYVIVQYGGFHWCGVNCYGDNTALHIYDGGSVTLDHAAFAHNGGYALWAMPSATTQLVVTHSTIGTSDLSGIKLDGFAGNKITITENTFTGNAAEAVNLAFNGGSVTALDGNTGSGNGTNGIQVSGIMGMDTTLPGNPAFAYVVNGGLTVDTGKTLTLQPGAVVKFATTGDGLAIKGTLSVPGTAISPVTFTSLKDDGPAGDTNHDGAGSTPVSGNWNSIVVASSGAVNLTYANVSYGGFWWCGVNCYGDHTPLHVTDGGAVTLDHASFAHNGGYAVQVLPSATSQLVVTHSTIGTSELGGIKLDGIAGNQVTITGNTFTGNGAEAVNLVFSGGSITALDGNSGSGNGTNGIQVSGEIGMDTALPGNPTFAYVVNGGLTVDVGKTLTLQPGTVVKFAPNDTLQVNGSLNVPGTNAALVTFTSIKDDDPAGDTNNDEANTHPAAGNWNSIVVASTGILQLTYADVRYGGFQWCGVNCYGNLVTLLLQGSASANLQHSFIHDSQGHAIYASGNSGTTNLTIADLTIENNGGDGINIANSGTYTLSVSRTILQNNANGLYLSGSINAVVNHCNIYGNTMGINNQTPSPVDATYNWWGSSSGPAPAGTGNGVVGNVTVTPWLNVAEPLP